MMTHQFNPKTCASDCFGCKLITLSFGKVDIDGQKKWDKNHQRNVAAYTRLRHDGTQPKSVNGAAELESRAASVFEIESGINLGGNAKAGKQYDEIQGIIKAGGTV
jgi:hypothetical protein